MRAISAFGGPIAPMRAWELFIQIEAAAQGQGKSYIVKVVVDGEEYDGGEVFLSAESDPLSVQEQITRSVCRLLGQAGLGPVEIGGAGVLLQQAA